MGQFLQDLRFGARSLVRSPGFAAVALATLALGIGANTAIFSVVEAVLLRPLPFPAADRLVAVVQTLPSRGVRGNGASYLNYADWQSRARSFEHLSAIEKNDRFKSVHAGHHDDDAGHRYGDARNVESAVQQQRHEPDCKRAEKRCRRECHPGINQHQAELVGGEGKKTHRERGSCRTVVEEGEAVAAGEAGDALQ